MHKLTMIERHLIKSVERPEDCWPYPGYCNRRTGYGNAYVHGRRVEAHRAAYELLVGPLPAGTEIDHLCRNRACCNPAHLEPVPHRVNLLRGESPSAHQARQSHCVHGHLLSGDNLWRDKRGRRHCLACRARRALETYYRRTERTPPEVPYHASDACCSRGHERTAETTYVNRNGIRVCRVCQALHQRAYRKRQHQSAASDTGR